MERDALVDGSRDHAKAATDDAKSANEEDARVMVESGEGKQGLKAIEYSKYQVSQWSLRGRR